MGVPAKKKKVKVYLLCLPMFLLTFSVFFLFRFRLRGKQTESVVVYLPYFLSCVGMGEGDGSLRGGGQ